MTKNNNKKVTIGGRWVSINDITDIAHEKAQLILNQTPEFVQSIDKGADFLRKVLAENGTIYGVTTGYGDSCTETVVGDHITQLPLHLSRYHRCGLGNYFSPSQVRAIMATRLTSLSVGFSGVRYTLLAKIENLLNHEIYPLIPEEGSVGASGDLTPLAYLCAALVGEGNVIYKGQVITAKEALLACEIKPVTLAPKEALAVMNGTAVMTAIACMAYQRACYLAKLAARVTAMATIALKANYYHFNERLFSVKPHPGQMEIARWIREDLGFDVEIQPATRLQNRYSIRCAPHVIGALQDALPWLKTVIENELNSANDNPVIDVDNAQILHGGHFYGGHIAMAMDMLKTSVANLADLLDRQLALLIDVKFNNGLPANLSGASKETASINHGFKAVQISVSAWTAEALKHTMPASVFSRSTECHNQDKVSMGTIAARDCLRVLTLTEQVFAAHLLAVTQAIQLRIEQNNVVKNLLTPEVSNMLNDILQHFDIVREDRALEDDLRFFMSKIQAESWRLYDE